MAYRYYSAPALAPQPVNNRRSGFSRGQILGGFIIGIATVMAGNLHNEKVKARRFQLEELEKATKNFSNDCLVGSGAFGNVYKGTFDVEGTLAIKKARVDSYQSVQEFRNEVELLSRVRHRNLVGLVGYCEEAGAKGAKVLVYEYVPNGSLLEYIIGRRGRTLTWRQRVNLAIGAAKGIAHLHEGVKPSIIHRDIKPSNILVGDGFEAKVSDFGLVKLGPVGDESHVSSQIKGTPGYLDPAYCTSFHLSPFSDARPSLERGSVEDILDANLLLEPCNMEMMLKMGKLGLRCVVEIPKERPTMTQVWKELEEALYSVDYFIHKQPSRGSLRSMESFVSIDGIGLQRFLVDMDSLSFQSTSLRCLETNSISTIDAEANNLGEISEESSSDEETSLTRD
ncbi:hypothetical protein HHK36_008727 [Tetracentron sinense]|uniref:non-specific serine/threonine protein kinase n=1 Tax=Tetracentron sinense TaxID=13715 RepID=A0A835DNH0_TETSI|nr:hypothetical protein HHK36_008727 [Tetracentron sinense]